MIVCAERVLVDLELVMLYMAAADRDQSIEHEDLTSECRFRLQ